MHLSLYRKFRPDSFEKIVRQEHIVRVLKNQIEGGSVGHAYLFCGPRGTGKTSVARIFARAINCESPKDGSPCGKCPTCLALQKGNLDISEIDAASNNGVNEMRDLREKVQYPPVTGKYKVYIVDEVHMLTDSAFNALLKTLEEPPAHAVFILATTEPHKIPATILSRCMRLDFKLIPEEDLERHLETVLQEIGKPYEKEAVSAIARAGAGSDRDMLSIAEMCIAYGDKLTYENVNAVLGAADFSETCDLCEALLGADMPSMLERAETILAEGKAVAVLLRDLLEMLNRIAIAKTCRNAEKLLSLPQHAFLRVKQAAEAADGRAILRATEILSVAETDLRLVSSPRIRLETALMRIAMPAADGSPDALRVRLDLLEKKLKEGSISAGETPEKREKAPIEQRSAGSEKAEPSAPQEDAPPIPEEPPEEFFSPFESAEKKEISAPEVKKNDPSPSASPRGQMTAEYAYGMFIKLLRKSAQNIVLRVLCSELSAAFEGDTFVLTTESPTVFHSLERAEHRETMGSFLAQIGIEKFEVRLNAPKPPDGGSPVDELRRDFPDYPIEIK